MKEEWNKNRSVLNNWDDYIRWCNPDAKFSKIDKQLKKEIL